VAKKKSAKLSGVAKAAADLEADPGNAQKREALRDLKGEAILAAFNTKAKRQALVAGHLAVSITKPLTYTDGTLIVSGIEVRRDGVIDPMPFTTRLLNIEHALQIVNPPTHVRDGRDIREDPAQALREIILSLVKP
jgi:hypothetical protein